VFLTKTKRRTLKIDSAAYTGSHGKYMKYISFPWLPVVAAHDRKTFARALRSIAGSKKAILIYTSFRSRHSVQTVQKTICDQNRVCYDNQ